jgi:type II secretory pathway component PulK
VALGAVLALIAVVADLPMALLTVLTALGGASVTVAGVMLLFGVVSVGDFDSAATTQTLDDQWWWYVLYLGLAVAGMIAQLRSTQSLRASLRQSWAESGGRELRSA